MGLDGISVTPFQCMGLGGFLPQLIVYMLLPPIALLLACSFVFMQQQPSKGRRRMLDRAEQLLPLCLFISFIAFPMVSSQARLLRLLSH